MDIFAPRVWQVLFPTAPVGAVKNRTYRRHSPGYICLIVNMSIPVMRMIRWSIINWRQLAVNAVYLTQNQVDCNND